MIDDRVGYATTGVILNHIEDYIKAYTINGKYIGKPEYLTKYEQMLKYQTGGDKYETTDNG